ncbi:hypothetical protein CW304_24250 [Bacillus sp. UFRGS-B20]|nr:hypothetical protein CW304_24250 [Bacillus sp. UFRGS-B20]
MTTMYPANNFWNNPDANALHSSLKNPRNEPRNRKITPRFFFPLLLHSFPKTIIQLKIAILVRALQRALIR